MRKHQIKRLLSGALALTMLVAAGSAAAENITRSEGTIVFGDVDKNNQVDAADALKALQNSVNLSELTEEEKVIADVNVDGAVDAGDALMMLQHSVSLIYRFPADTMQGQAQMPWSESTRAYVQNAPAVEVDGIRTTYQVSGGYVNTTDIKSDAIMTYINTFDELYKIDSWHASGATQRVDAMIAAGRAYGEFEKYYPERAGKDIQIDAAGNPVYVGGTTVNYMLPTKYFAEYKWSLVDAICQKGVGAVVMEEPECFVYGSYSEGFKEAWQEYYNEPWEDMTSSAEAQYKTCKLMTHMWEEYVNLIGERMEEKYPEVELWVAAHSTISYNTFPIVSCLNTFTNSPYIDGYIGQTWSGTTYTPIPYGGEQVRRLFEESFIEYASYPDAMVNQNYYSLSDTKDDNPDHTWEFYQTMWSKTLAAQLMQQEVNRFQSFIWPHRAFEVCPDYYKTIQLSVFNAIDELIGQESSFYAGTSGISIGLSDTLTWQHGESTMQTKSTNDGFYGLTIPLIERGIPLKVTSLDKLGTSASLDGVEVLILSYELMKPVSEEVNEIIAGWVKQGGVLLYIGGDDSYDDIRSEWWGQKGETPLSNLLGHLGLDGVTNGSVDYITDITWCGPAEYGESLQKSIIYISPRTMTYEGEGLTSILNAGGLSVGMRASVGKGQVITCGLPASYFSSEADGPQNLRDLVEYATSFSKKEYLETSLMAVKRGPFLAASALDHSTGETLTGNFIDLFDEDLPIITSKSIAAGDDAVLLRDITDKMTTGTPRLAHTGGNIKGDLIETSETTRFSFVGPTNSVSATRILGNGKYPQEVKITRNGEEYSAAVYMWDNATSSLLLKVENSVDVPVDVEIVWGDTAVADDPVYTIQRVTVATNSLNADQAYIERNTSNANETLRFCDGYGELVYKFDLSNYEDLMVNLDVMQNYLVSVSDHDGDYVEIATSRDDNPEHITGSENRTQVSVIPSLYGIEDTLYVRISNSFPGQGHGGGIASFTLVYKEPAE